MLVVVVVMVVVVVVGCSLLVVGRSVVSLSSNFCLDSDYMILPQIRIVSADSHRSNQDLTDH